MTSPSRISTSNPGEFLAVIPLLHGYHPRECLTVTCVRDKRVQVSAGISFSELADDEMLSTLIELVEQHDTVFAVGWSEYEHLAWQRLRQFESLFPSHARLEMYWCDGKHWKGRHGEHGIVDPKTSDRANVMAKERCLPIANSRDDLRSLVYPSTDSRLDFSPSLAEAQRAVDSMSQFDREARSVTLAMRSLDDGLSGEELIELGLLVENIHARDAALLVMNQQRAREFIGLWRDVISHLPENHAQPAVCLLGLAGWLMGNGALLNICADRSFELDPEYSLGSLLREISLHAINPRRWDEIVRGHVGE